MLELPGVTLCCADTANHALALRALGRSSVGVRFARTLFITDRMFDEAGIDVAVVGRFASRETYSRFVLKSLLSYIDTPHVLLIQWDGYVTNPAAWRDDFLACDYIGARWFWHTDGMCVGNGGFSLRSRKLLDALQDPRIELTEAEDVTICRAFRPLLEREYRIEFASEELADVFAFETAYPVGKPFGFHGLFNFCRVVPPDELTQLVSHFTDPIARSPQLIQLGRNCLALAQWQPAAAIFQRILDENPGNAAAAAGLASATAGASASPVVGRNDPCPCGSGKRYKNCHGAIGSAVARVALPPRATDHRLTQALELHERGDTVAAERIYRIILAHEPENARARHYLGVVHYQRKELDVALPLLQDSVNASPDEPEFQNNLGLVLAAADRESDAISAYRAALALKSDYAAAWNNLGLALQAQNDVTGAIAAFRRAVELKPDFAHAHWNLALALLLDGQFVQGWPEYDWRLSLPELGAGRHVYAGPAWDGRSPTGKTILLYAEQGLGDALQFARYASLLARAGCRVVICCPKPLQPLLATVQGVAQAVCPDESLPFYDAHFPLMSLPRVFGTKLESIPAGVPYIHVPHIERKPELPATAQRLKVGLAWAGSKAHSNDRNRSCPLSVLAPLLDATDIAWFSLQQGQAAAQTDDIAGGRKLAPLAAHASLADTAALVAELDLVISVDTSIVHLAGALGQRCWVLLPYAPDWRWLLDREDTPWYPTLRLFRQPQPRDWPALVARVASELRALTQ